MSAHVGKRESRNAAIDTNYPHSKIILLYIFSERARRKERKPKCRHWYKLPAFQNHFKVKVFCYHFICIFSDRAHWKEESPNAAIDTNYPHSKIISEWKFFFYHFHLYFFWPHASERERFPAFQNSYFNTSNLFPSLTTSIIIKKRSNSKTVTRGNANCKHNEQLDIQNQSMKLITLMVVK